MSRPGSVKPVVVQSLQPASFFQVQLSHGFLQRLGITLQMQTAILCDVALHAHTYLQSYWNSHCHAMQSSGPWLSSWKVCKHVMADQAGKAVPDAARLIMQASISAQKVNVSRVDFATEAHQHVRAA